jgi:phosphate transport system protein
MTKHLTRDLEGLERRLLLLAGEVEEAVRRSVRALVERRMELAERVIEGDDSIDRLEVEIEDECLKMLALHQPVASDLRFIVASLKSAGDLERIGDLAGSIAERAISFAARSDMPLPPRLHEMVEACARMLRSAIEAFVRGDSAAARELLAQDERIDTLNRDVIQGCLSAMHDDPAAIDQAVDLISISKNLERIGDHVTNIAEDVVYLVEGDIIRHHEVLSRKLATRETPTARRRAP